MPLLILALGLMAFLVLITLTLPFSIINRYRAGTARRRARSWLALTNLFSLGISALFFLVTAVVSSFWVPRLLSFCAGGFLGGLLLGIVGLRLTRWEVGSQALYYLPNRWLVLAITVGVSLRLAFGFWRVWDTWHTSPTGHSWLAESGFAGSMAAGAVLLGYYLTYWFGIWTRVRRAVAQSK
jgi:hypothetical protein